MGEVLLTELAQRRAEEVLKKEEAIPVDTSLDAETQKNLDAARKELL